MTVNQNLIDNKIKVINDKLKKIKTLVNDDNTELKEHFRIQEDHSQKNSVRVNGIHEDENESLEETETKLEKFLWDELEITKDL